MATLRINDMVINPALSIQHDPIFNDLMEPTPETLRVVRIVERDMTTDEQGYTKSVQESSAPDAYVILDGGEKYRLDELTNA